MRTFTELSRLNLFVDRYDYLRIGGVVGESTFGFERVLNQDFYHSTEWRQSRSIVIARDQGYDLGASEYLIKGPIQIHHMNPIIRRDIEERSDNLLDPEYLISASHRTHNAIHYGDENLLPQPYVERAPDDTIGWRRLS